LIRKLQGDFLNIDVSIAEERRDCRVISGIVNVLRSGGRWIDAPPEYGPRKTLYNRYVRWAAKRRLDRFVPRACAGRRAARASLDRQLRRESASLGFGRKRGEKNQAIGRSRGGRTTKIHALTDAECRPLSFTLTGGQVADCRAGAELLARLPPRQILHADKGYDSNAIRRQVEERSAIPNIPPKANRNWKNCFSPFLYRARNAIDIDQAWRLSRLYGGDGGFDGRFRRQAAPGRRGGADRLQRRDRLGIGAHKHAAFRAGADVAPG
jgi:transposase